MSHGMQYSRSLISEDDSVTPSASRVEEGLHFDAAGFPALLPPNSQQVSAANGDAMLTGSQQRAPAGSIRDSSEMSEGRAEGDGKYGLLGLLDVLRMSDKVTNSYSQCQNYS